MKKKKVFKGWMDGDEIPKWLGASHARHLSPTVYFKLGKARMWGSKHWPPRKVTVTFEWEEE